MRRILSAFVGILCAASLCAQESKVFYTDEDVAVFDRYRMEFADRRDLPLGDLIVETGKYFIDVPYGNYTLEVREPEELVVNLRELDCVTFVESTIALARTIKSDSASFELFCDNLLRLRYRGGELVDFTSRLHYFSDWINDNREMGMAEDITEQLGGDPYPVRPKIMSKVPQNYRQLVKNPDFIPVLSAVEDSLAGKKFFSVPESKVKDLGGKLENGLVIGTTTPGVMDITHVGFICLVDGKPHFMHASSEEKKVVITEGTLSDYLKKVRSMTGIMAVRMLDDDPQPETVTAVEF